MQPARPRPTRIVPRTGAEAIRRVNLGTHWWQDGYHTALTMRWPSFVAWGSALYVTVNVMFAGLYLLQPGSITNARPGSFVDAFFFSVQCISTIGFGTLAPATLYANFLTTAEAIVSLAIVALATGLVFARFSRPRARVMFAHHAVVSPYNGVPTLMLRIGNARLSQILEAEVSVTLLRSERTLEGESYRRFYDLALARSHTPVFALTFAVMHPIDEQSPLHRYLADGWDDDAEILITVTGLEEITSTTLHARHSYRLDEVLWGRRFSEIFKVGADGGRFIDYGGFHNTEPAIVHPD